jgi:TonB family protein
VESHQPLVSPTADRGRTSRAAAALGISVTVHAAALLWVLAARVGAPLMIAPIGVTLHGGGHGRGAAGEGDGAAAGAPAAGPSPTRAQPPAAAGRAQRGERSRLPAEAAVRVRSNAAGAAEPSGAPAIVAARGTGAAGGAADAGLGSGAGTGDGAGGGSGGDLRGRCVACPAPPYPPQAWRNGWQGRVEVRLRIDGAGRVAAAEVARSSGHAALDRAAVAAARDSRFTAAAGDGFWGRMGYGFELDGGDQARRTDDERR